MDYVGFGGCTESMVLCIPIGRNWHEMELLEDCNPSAILQSCRNRLTDGSPHRSCSIYGGPSVHRLLSDFLIALRLLWDSGLRYDFL